MGTAGLTLGAGAGVGRFIGHAFGAQAPAAATRIQVPPGGIIRTIRGDLDPNTIMGATLMHEHVGSGRPPAGRGPNVEPNPTTDGEWMAQELTIAHDKAGSRHAGGGQPHHPGARERALPDGALAALERAPRGGGGLLPAARTIRPAPTRSPRSELAELLVRGAASARLGALRRTGRREQLGRSRSGGAQGVPRVRTRAGAHQRADLHAQQLRHRRATSRWTWRCASSMRSKPAAPIPRAVALGHVCCLFDPMVDVAKRVARRGAFIAFDRVTRQQQWVSDEQPHHHAEGAARRRPRAVDPAVVRLHRPREHQRGRGERLPGPLHGRDGGPGYARPLVLFVPLLRKAGIPDDVIRRITQDNPRRFLTFVPKKRVGFAEGASMEAAIAGLVQRFEQGALSRRELIQGLSMLALGWRPCPPRRSSRPA